MTLRLITPAGDESCILILSVPLYGGFLMPLPLMGDSWVFQFGDCIFIEAKASIHTSKPRTMNTTQYAECLEILWKECPATKAEIAIYKYLADCKNGKHGKQMAETALRISQALH